MADEIKRLQEENKFLKERIKLNDKYFGDSKKGNKKLRSDLKELKNLAKATNDAYDDQVDNLKNMSKTVGKLNLKGALNVDEAAKLNDEMTSLLNELAKIKKAHPKHEAAWKRQRDRVAEVTERVEDLKKTVDSAGRSTKSLAKEGPSFLKKWASEAEGVSGEIGGYGLMFDKAGKSLSKMPGLMGTFGKAVKGVGVGVGKLAGALAGIPGIILMGVKALWDLGMAADTFVKDANKAFAYLRGPDIMTGDVEKQFKEFNDQIFQTGKNLETGLDVSQIRELMEATMQAGYNIQNLNKGMLTYRDAIYVASKASKTLGMVLPQVGSIMGTLMTDFRMDLQKVDEAFVQVAFDAKKSGLSTDRFWNTVQNASASLALYGVFVKDASKTMKAFTESAVGGAKESAEATENMYDIFRQESIANNATIIDMAQAGGTNFREAFEEAAGEIAERNVRIQEELRIEEAKQKPDVEQIKKLRAELYANQSKIADYMSVSKKSSVEQSAYMGALAGEAPAILMDMLKGLGQLGKQGDLSQISNQKMLVLLKAAKDRGVSETTVRMLIGNAKATRKKMEALVSLSATHFKNVEGLDEKNRKKLSDSIRKVINTSGEDQIEATDELKTNLMNILGINDYQAGIYADMVKLDKKAANNLTDLINGDKKSLKELQKIAVSQKTVQEMTAHNFEKEYKTQEEMAEAADKTFKSIVDETLSYEDMKKIATDEIKWRTSSLELAQQLNGLVFDVLKFITKDEVGYLSGQQKIAQDQLKTEMKNDEKLSKLLTQTDENGNLLKSAQIEASKIIGEKIAQLEDKISVRKEAGGIIREAKKAEDPYEVLNKAIEETSGELQTELVKARESLIPLGIVQDNLSDILKETEKGTDPYLIKAFGEMKKKLYVQEREGADPEFIKYQKGILKDIQDLSGMSEDERKEKTAEIQKKIQKLEEEKLGSLAKSNDKIKEEAEEQKTIQDGMQKNLKSMDKTNNIIANLSKLQFKASPEYSKTLVDEIEKSGAKTAMDYKNLATMLNISPEEMKKAFKTEKKKVPEKLEVIQEGEWDSATLVAGATLAEPIKVSSPGAMVLHPGEMILPKSYSEFKAIPAAPGPVGATVGTGGKKEVNINVVATEKDLGQKIANEIRKVMYNEQLTGMA